MRNLTKRGLPALAGVALVVGLASAYTVANADESDLPPEDLPAASAFKGGTCQATANDVLGMAALARKIVKSETVDAKDRAELRDRQWRIAQARSGADEQLAKPLQDLVTSIGWVRIRFNGQTYDPKVVQNMDQTRRAYQALCVG